MSKEKIDGPDSLDRAVEKKMAQKKLADRNKYPGQKLEVTHRNCKIISYFFNAAENVKKYIVEDSRGHVIGEDFSSVRDAKEFIDDSSGGLSLGEKKMSDYGKKIKMSYKGSDIVVEPSPSGFVLVEPVDESGFKTSQEAIKYAKEFIDNHQDDMSRKKMSGDKKLGYDPAGVAEQFSNAEQAIDDCIADVKRAYSEAMRYTDKSSEVAGFVNAINLLKQAKSAL